MLIFIGIVLIILGSLCAWWSLLRPFLIFTGFILIITSLVKLILN
jgi:uncharacterized membrane protein